MSDLRAAAQQALEALEWMSNCYVGEDDEAGECASCHERSYKPHHPNCRRNNAITALRAALDAPELQRDPLTDDEIYEIAAKPAAISGHYVMSFARAIEKAHGIGDSNA